MTQAQRVRHRLPGDALLDVLQAAMLAGATMVGSTERGELWRTDGGRWFVLVDGTPSPIADSEAKYCCDTDKLKL